MSVYAISDLHLSLATGKSKEMDVFPEWENYVAKIEKNWNETVGDGDTVIIAGDLSWAMSLENAFEDFDFLNSLPGKKILIKGNHDYWWSSRNKIDNYLIKNGFSAISVLHNSAKTVERFAICGTRGWILESKEDNDIKILNREVCRLETSIKMGKNTGFEPIVFLHYPPVYDIFECKEIMDVLVKNKIKKCYYGHLHGKLYTRKARIGIYKGIDFRLISADYLNFTPILVY